MSFRLKFRAFLRKQRTIQSLLKLRNKHKAAKLNKMKLSAIHTHGTFGAGELLDILRKNEIEEGDVLFVQCSFNDLYTFSGTPIDLLACIRTAIGQSGTLLMPAYTMPWLSKTDNRIEIEFEPTYTGIVSEIFRRSPDVIRSLHPRHSICGHGPLAEELLKNHHKCSYADGVGSPFDKMRKLRNSKILTLGLPDGYISFLHWIEDIDPEKLPYRVHTTTPETYMISMPDGSFYPVKDFQIDRSFVRLSLSKTCDKLSVDIMKKTKYKGVQINVYNMSLLADELVKLRDQGIIHWRR